MTTNEWLSILGIATVCSLSGNMVNSYHISRLEEKDDNVIKMIIADYHGARNDRNEIFSIFSEHYEKLNQKFEFLESKIDNINETIDSDEKRKVRIKKVIAAIKETTKFKNPHKGCRDYPTPGELWTIGSAIIDMADKYAVDAALILAITRQESAFCNEAVSPVGARGYMQLMPDTATYVANDLDLPLKPWRRRDNIQLGTAYISQMLSEFEGDIGLAVRAYNNGPHNVKKVLKGIRDDYPEETKNYIVRVLEFKQQYEAMGVQ